MTHVLCLVLLGALLAAGEATPITTGTIAGAKVVTVAVPAGWSSAIVLVADRDCFIMRPDRVLIDVGPSSTLQARIAGVSADHPSTANVPYFLGFTPRVP